MSTTPLEVIKAPVLEAGEIEKVLIGGDLAQLKTEHRIEYYSRVCASLGLNPLTQPFAYLSLSGKLTLYARKDAAEQLRSIRRISLKIAAREVIDGMYVVTCEAATPEGRTDMATGVIDLSKVSGEAKANAMMKAETKAKRRVTLSICGLGLMDETEVETVPGARKVSVEDAHSGKLLSAAVATSVALHDAMSNPPATEKGGASSERGPRAGGAARAKGGGAPAPPASEAMPADKELEGYLARILGDVAGDGTVHAELCSAIEVMASDQVEAIWTAALKKHGDPATVPAPKRIEVGQAVARSLYESLVLLRGF